MSLEPSPAKEKTLQPGKWYGRIAMLCALIPLVSWCCYVLYLLFLPQSVHMAANVDAILVFTGLPCLAIAILFGLKGIKTEGRHCARMGLKLSFLCVLMIMMAGFMDSVFTSQEAARRMQCSSYSKGILLAFHNYSDTHGALPPLYTVDDEGKPLHSWRVLILPFLEQQDLYNQIRLDEPWDSEYNKQFHDRMF